MFSLMFSRVIFPATHARDGTAAPLSLIGPMSR